MPFTNAPATDELLTANGGADGYATVTSNAAYYPGAFVWLLSSGQASKRYVVTDLSGATKVGLREVLDWDDNVKRAAGPQYGRTPINQYTTAQGAKISQERSTVYVEDSTASVKVSKLG
jgi:hypothetical protein